jgi:hypothetical protein
MTRFVPLGVSVFDTDFTLDPYPYLKDLYSQQDILGFHADGMNFCFRFEDCHELISAHSHVAREPVATEETARQQQVFAQQYPTRAWHFHYSLTDVKVKGLLNRYLLNLLDRVTLGDAEPVFSVLSTPGLHDDYLAEVRLLPMRMLLMAWGFSFTDEQLQRLYDTSIAMVKSFDNYEDVALLKEGEEGMAYNRDYVTEQFNKAPPGTLLYDFASESRAQGFDDNYSIASLVTFVQSTPNTISVSTAFMLRNILRFGEAVKPLRDNPQLINDNVVMEFLRRDNHVKALSRQVHSGFALRGHQVEKGDSLYIFYPGINLDPDHWDKPLELNFQRQFTRDNHNIFGGSRYACIGSRIALKYFSAVLPGILANLSDSARIIEDEIEVDGNWVAERVITRLPILVQ